MGREVLEPDSKDDRKRRKSMGDILSRMYENLIGRVSGPMDFRIILQPLMAVIFATRDGIRDAHAGKPAYFWAMFTSPDHRRDLLQSGWKSVGRIFILALILDAIYQVWQFHWFYPGGAIFVAVLLAIVPYLLVRGPVNRIMRHKKLEGDLWVYKPVTKLPR
jgi:hypothetical protein